METFTPFPVDFITDNTLLNEDDPYFSLSQFDFELQQQAQAALQQESWQDFDKYLSLETNFNAPMMDSTSFNDPSLIYAPLNLPEKKEEWPNDVKQEYGTPESIPYSPLLQQDAKNVNLNQSPKLAQSTPTLNWSSEVPIQRLKQINTVNNAVNAVLNNVMPVRQHKKTAHNAIERRYRNNINDRIAELKNAVPALLYAKVKDNRKRPHKNDEEDDGEDGEEFLDGVAVATKLNKATILRKATEYINHLKKTGQDLKQENEILQRILTQLPGGPEILQRYHLQKQQRDQELARQQMVERELEKQQEQQRKAANRKRARYSRQHPEDEDESSSSSSSDPNTPPSSRVFMAMFMAITFFSTSPLTQNTSHPQTKEAIKESSIFSSFQFDSTWSVIRTCIFLLFIIQWVFPLIRSYLFSSSVKLKRVNRIRTPIKLANASPGDLKSQQIYSLLTQSDQLPKHLLSTLFSLAHELLRLFSHHYLGYDILYEDDEQVFDWIQLNEQLCLGASAPISRLTMIYSCLRMINAVHLTDQGHSRAYATAAMQCSLLFPSWLAERLSGYLWRSSDQELIPEPEHPIFHCRAWTETIELLSNQIQPDQGLCLSYVAPVLVPVEIISSLHWLDCLQGQFQLLVTLLAEGEDDLEFQPILESMQDDEGLARWLATVGFVVESIWKDQEVGDTLESLARVPRSITASVGHKKEMNQLDELLKKSMVHTLVGAVYLKSEDADKRKRGLAELKLTQGLRLEIQSLQSKIHERRQDLESTVLSLADFVVCFVGIEAWLTAMELEDEDMGSMETQIKENSLCLRRMLRHPYLKSMVQTKDILERLTDVNLFMEHPATDTDSACDMEEASELVKRAKKAQAMLHGYKD
ncbi:hypothetical protein G6F56_003618 [Rhizopus delemar]|uniref:BHLH domain-containing protein n=1 Tax=Rhizopus stolonifer TaxID=4846 RepID=A0A367KY98_RHIST|nr:hypothetical protein G6F56_003618 [Rhizopus delemar]RCI07181.1 hypothetical protein CU098_013981 [Rhizopus stolonifer]